MKETIELLKLLQEKDILLAETLEIMESIPKMLKEEEEKIQVLRRDFDKKNANLSEIKKDFRHKERELKDCEEKTKGFKSHFYEVKTKKELDALEDEIKKTDALKEKLEEECLLLMDTIEVKEREVQREEKEITTKEIAFKNEREEKEKELKGASEKYEALSQERKDLEGKIEKRTLELYETIRSKKDNIALAQVLNNTCSLCQMGLRPQIINEIKEANSIARCESCLRILYI
ncbi:MAG: C4-type zinc ribbon domain-containing protein [bacterium]